MVKRNWQKSRIIFLRENKHLVSCFVFYFLLRKSRTTSLKGTAQSSKFALP